MANCTHILHNRTRCFHTTNCNLTKELNTSKSDISLGVMNLEHLTPLFRAKHMLKHF